MNHFEGTIICAVFALPFIAVTICIILMHGLCLPLIPAILMAVTLTAVGLMVFMDELRDYRNSTERV